MSESSGRWIRRSLLLLSVIFVCAGAARGEAQTVLTKAVNICLECIGIG